MTMSLPSFILGYWGSSAAESSRLSSDSLSAELAELRQATKLTSQSKRQSPPDLHHFNHHHYPLHSFNMAEKEPQSSSCTINSLVSLIKTHPIIDHHAHAISKIQHDEDAASEGGSGHRLEHITSEAHGPALKHAPNTLAHARAVRQLSTGLFECEQSWDGIKKCRGKKKLEGLTKMCFRGIQTMLIDDGLGDPSSFQENKWHDTFLRTPGKRIVRIEKVAEDILLEVFHDEGGNPPNELFDSFIARFSAEIDRCLEDDYVAGFKSVICYRSGLQINVDLVVPDDIYSAISSIKAENKQGKKPRIDHKPLNDYLILKVCSLMKAKATKPIQFHTGLGDNDIDLRLANPAHMQPFIEAHPNIPMVLLHSSYPFVREAGYLASVYDNVYLDFGLVFPLLSRDGQEAVVKQCLELTPWTKLLWSTDGNHYPEMYWLGTTQVREALEKVLISMVSNGDLSVSAAHALVKHVLFETANRVYKLNLTPIFDMAIIETVEEKKEEVLPLQKFLQRHPKVKYFRLCWTDYTGTTRCRIQNRKFYQEIVGKGQTYATLTKAALQILQDDSPIPSFSPVGDYELTPDFSSLRIHPKYAYSSADCSGEKYLHHANVQCYLRSMGGSPEPLCPRTVLYDAIEYASSLDLSLKAGFEIEFVILKQEYLTDDHDETEIARKLVPVSDAHCYSSTRSLQNKSQDILEEIVDTLEQAGIEVQQFHPESAPGQYEIVLGPSDVMGAVDALLHARECVTYVCSKYDLRATMMPKPFAMAAGNASHAHISVSPVEKHTSFIAGVLENLRAICAFSLGSQASYERVSAGSWSGGVWSCWGTRNKEAPARLVSDEEGHWEIKTVDGMANMYLAMAAIVRAGCIGVELNMELMSDCLKDPSKLSDDERSELGITHKIPSSMKEALSALKNEKGDLTSFSKALGEALVKNYIEIKEGEEKLFENLGDDLKRKIWLAERY